MMSACTTLPSMKMMSFPFILAMSLTYSAFSQSGAVMWSSWWLTYI